MRKQLRHRNPNDPLTLEEAERLAGAPCAIEDDRQTSVLFSIGIGTGMRVSEVIGIEVRDIDFESGYIQIWDEKKDKKRKVYCSDRLLEMLFEYVKGEDDGVRLFPFTDITAERRIHKWTVECGIKKRSWHALRATFATLSSKAGVSIDTIANSMGDKPGTVYDCYIKDRPEDMRAELNRSGL